MMASVMLGTYDVSRERSAVEHMSLHSRGRHFQSCPARANIIIQITYKGGISGIYKRQVGHRIYSKGFTKEPCGKGWSLEDHP